MALTISECSFQTLLSFAERQVFKKHKPKYSQMLSFAVFGHKIGWTNVGRQSCFGPKKCTVSGLKRQFDKWHLFRAPTPPPMIRFPPPFVHALSYDSFSLEETGTDQTNPTFCGLQNWCWRGHTMVRFPPPNRTIRFAPPPPPRFPNLSHFHTFPHL